MTSLFRGSDDIRSPWCRTCALNSSPTSARRWAGKRCMLSSHIKKPDRSFETGIVQKLGDLQLMCAVGGCAISW